MTLRDIDAAVNLIGSSQKLVAFTGAGISTASGIPDFRSPDSGLWSGVDPLKVASIYGFRQNPQCFYDWFYPLAQLTFAAQPNIAHLALAAMEQQGLLKGLITQNIDMLHGQAGSTAVYELHGHLREATCVQCFATYPAADVLLQFLESRVVPCCSCCNGVLKPNVILFGEQLPVSIFTAARKLINQADVILVVGSSLEVAPAADLPINAACNGANLVIVNLQPTPADSLASIIIREDATVVLPAIMKRLQP